MDKRLEEIKDWVRNFIGNEDTDYPTLRLDDYTYLVKQAEEKQRLEEEYQVRETDLLEEHIERLEILNQSYKQALEFYATEDYYEEMDYEDFDSNGELVSRSMSGLIEDDEGEKARQALEDDQ